MQMYYVAIRNQQYGPYAEEVLRRLMQTDQVTPDSLAWCDTLTEWTPVNRIPELLVLWTETKRFPPQTPPTPLSGGVSGETSASPNESQTPPASDVSPSVGPMPGMGPRQMPGQVPWMGQPYLPSYAMSWNRGFANFFQRMVAMFVDGLILSLLSFSLLFIMASLLVILERHGERLSPEEAEQLGMSLSALFCLVSMIVSWLYYAISESSTWQATLGKRLMGIYVVDIYGQRISFGRATCRYFCKIPSSFFGIGFLLALVTPRNQTLHDLLANTLVLKR
ncbi:MAG: RDD family protein [Thermoguttaceae bacterium]|nr:RDD family protein [Thermoguttaceae bacterium]